MRRLDSLILTVADRTTVPAGAALAVDRVRFPNGVTEAVAADPLITLHRAELGEIPSGVTIVASGPLTSPGLSSALERLFGERHLYFYDAIAPIVTFDSIDMAIAYKASRYGKGGDDYVNCPMTREEYYAFVDAVLAAEKMPAKQFERTVYFEGCMPIEEMARRGRDTLAFGPMRPVGLTDPRTGTRPYAVVQLRQDDAEGRLFNMVGFQTKMTYPEQRRVFRMIPGLAGAEFVRLGSLHRNTFIDSPSILMPTLQLRAARTTFLAGQIIGVEGYVESAAAGLLAGINAARLIAGTRLVTPPATTALGSLLAYVTQPGRKEFQPMNANYGLFPPLPGRTRGREKKLKLAERALQEFERWAVGEGLAVARDVHAAAPAAHEATPV
jgi:methylenetetrahydrofolate--tRNA-(uracil-5-)-methyltransferase